MSARPATKLALKLPLKIGAGGTAIREPTKEEVRSFLEKLDKTCHMPGTPFFNQDDAPHTDSLIVRQWLEIASQ